MLCLHVYWWLPGFLLFIVLNLFVLCLFSMLMHGKKRVYLRITLRRVRDCSFHYNRCSPPRTPGYCRLSYQLKHVVTCLFSVFRLVVWFPMGHGSLSIPCRRPHTSPTIPALENLRMPCTISNQFSKETVDTGWNRLLHELALVCDALSSGERRSYTWD